MNNKKNKNINITKELKNSYLNYAMSVIINRAIPDIRDGLKPVHRRILYAMYILKNYYNKAYKKSARIVGDVIGKYHPHGDNAVYDSIVRMAQNFSMRYPLIDGQGNFGSIDGDSAAAMRYTEIRMSKITTLLLNDIEKKTVKFNHNYDSTEYIPEILPSKIPNILINGTTGIAVGMATNIPPHNITEIMKAFIKYIENKNITTKNLMKYIKGPDFPTGAIIEDNNGLYNAYKTGKGTIKVIAKIKKENITINNKIKKNIIITQLPYQINKSILIKKIIELIKEKKIDEINYIKDESDRKGTRIVIESKKNIKRKFLINKLIYLTNLKISYTINMVALYKKKPKIFNLKNIIKIFIKYRKQIIKNKIIFKLKKYKYKLHILKGYLICIYNIDKILIIIKQSENKKYALKIILKKKWNILNKNIINKNNKKKYKFTKKQINYILKLSLHKLTIKEQNNIYIKYKFFKKKINKYKKILNNKNLIINIIKKEFINIKNKFGDKRLTKIKKNSFNFKIFDLIKKKKIIILFTKTGYIKYSKLSNFNTQKRGGKGKKIIKLKENDYIKNMILTNTHYYILLFTNKGKILCIKIYKLLNYIQSPTGKPIVNFLKNKEKINHITSFNKKKNFKYIILITKLGIIKKILIKKINFKWKKGINLIKLKNKDKIINTHLLKTNNHKIMIITKKGKIVKFFINNIRNMNKNSYGIKAINLSKEDKVKSSLIIPMKNNNNDLILIITQNGYGKQTYINEFTTKSRGIKGLIAIKINNKNGFVSQALYIKNKIYYKLLILTNKGNLLKISNKNINILKRNTQGIILIRLKPLEKAISLVKI